jgi:putative transcriptional regulator
VSKRIVVTLDVMLARRKMKAKELAERIGITEANLSLLRTGKVKGVRFETLAKLCDALQCKPGDLLDCEDDPSSPLGAAVGGDA